jgi:hypothetical protein
MLKKQINKKIAMKERGLNGAFEEGSIPIGLVNAINRNC